MLGHTCVIFTWVWVSWSSGGLHWVGYGWLVLGWPRDRLRYCEFKLLFVEMGRTAFCWVSSLWASLGCIGLLLVGFCRDRLGKYGLLWGRSSWIALG